ncbi:antiterminator Q family protein [Enterobacter ludwigii]|uniref:antiterminator Q family protein n=1 Tax=Enterobacter ludwigii TaxID=299767 RepID=UPI001A590B8D|nr:antiterminator Q family protein [Enterobacter ludwigii]EME7881560.1 antitermination protein Q [Enterobacter hormaechei]EKV3583745.1 antitermination protein Q [Enterobacter ludwigii]MBK4424985.1 antitermination protein Q [Enterobacter hormaechei]MCE1419045.1 antitermination protein Q [Enterobacter hormaechei]MDF9916636.1 antiterminator Q family protein [Enterobacter ludwigii]
MRDIKIVLERWGGWASQCDSGLYYSTMAAGFKGLIVRGSNKRLTCTDNDALIIDGCLARLKNKRPYEHSLLVAHYLFGVSKRSIAKRLKKNEKQIRVEILMAEGFIDGCLASLEVKMEMDIQ